MVVLSGQGLSGRDAPFHFCSHAARFRQDRCGIPVACSLQLRLICFVWRSGVQGFESFCLEENDESHISIPFP